MELISSHFFIPINYYQEYLQSLIHHKVTALF